MTHTLLAYWRKLLAGLLKGLSGGLKALYGERYRGLMLGGSYARGGTDEGSHVDLLLLLDGAVDATREIIRAEDMAWPLSLESGYTVSLLPMSADACHNSEKPFLRNARKERVSVA